MSTTISGDASSLPLPTASCVEIKSTSSSTKGNTCSKILDIALAIVGALVVVAGVLALVLCASNVIFTAIGIAALIIGSACVGAGISRLMCRSSYASLEAKNVLAEQRLRNLSEEKDALVSVSFINKMFLRGLTDDLKALEAKAIEVEIDCLDRLEKNEQALLSDVRLVLSSYTRWLDSAEKEKAALKASIDANQAS